MTKNELKQKYFDWIYQLVAHADVHGEPSYHILLERLFDEEFRFQLPMDANRAEDGEELRYHFGHEQHISDGMVQAYLDDRPCSILEMMVALAIRCDEQIMYDPDAGSQVYIWFWEMIDSLGLSDMSDSRYRGAKVEEIINTFLNREYQKNGKGGLFYTRRPNVDMRNMEIWYQMCWYLNNEI